MTKQIYVASSWRCPIYRSVIDALKVARIPYYDFQQDGAAFDWSDVDPSWNSQAKERNKYSLPDMLPLLHHPLAQKGFMHDAGALYDSSALLLVLPCGKSAHLELGVAIGLRKPTAVLSLEPEEPELMYRLVDTMFSDIESAVEWCAKAIWSGFTSPQAEREWNDVG